jgi:hypothetical protein
MGLDPAAGQVDEQRGEEHLRKRDGVPRDGVARAKDGEKNGQGGKDAAEEDRHQDMEVQRSRRADPGLRRDPDREADAREPFEDQEPGEKMVGAPPDVPAVALEMVLRDLSHLGEVRELINGSGKWIRRHRGKVFLRER